MRATIKTFLSSNNPRKWGEYHQQFHQLFTGRDPHYDELLDFIRDFHSQFDTFPTFDNIQKQLAYDGDSKLLKYVEGIWTDPSVPLFQQDADFFAHLQIEEKTTIEGDLMGAVKTFQTAMAKGGTSLAPLMQKVDDLKLQLHQISAKAQRAQASSTTLLYGDEGRQALIDVYQNIQKKKHSQDSTYYTMGVPEFDERLTMKPGDLVFFGGYTSHGKSIWLRYLTYRLITEYGLNAFFLSGEMTREVVLTLFAFLHANNKKIFPGTPYLEYQKFQKGNLDEEEIDFLFNVAHQDLMENPAYGTIFIEQPNKSKYNLSDLDIKIMEVETSIMPVHVVAVDYLTMLWPLDHDRSRPDRSDYNQMIKDFKQMALTHKDARGKKAPFLGLTAAQISRDGLNRAIKNEGIYDMAAFAEFSEIERSADLMFSVLMTDEMRQINQMRVQNLKGRDTGVVSEPVTMNVDLARGFTLSPVSERSETEVVEALQSLNI